MGRTQRPDGRTPGRRRARKPRGTSHPRRGRGTFEDLDFDAVADLRFAVDEACTRLIRSAVPDSTLLLVVDPRDDAVVIDASTTCKSPDIWPRAASVGTCEFVTDEVRTFQEGGCRRGAGVRDLDDGETSEFVAVTPPTSQGSSSRSNSEYADVAEISANSRTYPKGIGEVSAPA